MIIQSLLDTDLYKFTMMQVVLHRFPGAIVEYRFKCRTEGIDLRPFAEEIRDEIRQLCQLRFKKDELDYLRKFSFFKSDFVDFLKIFQLNDEFIEVVADDHFDIIIKGPWLHTIMFEVPVLAIVSEVYYRNTQPRPNKDEGIRRLDEKIQFILEHTKPGAFKFSEFGTRRRFAKSWHENVVKTLKSRFPQNLAGTSNVMFAKQYDLSPIGTMAHEYIQACQSLGPRLVYSQKFAFENWAQEYRGELGIALSDVYGIDAFLNDFDLYFCKLFDGARHDSGDPFIWGDRMIEHYQKNRVDPKTKTLVFTDALDFETALKIFNRFKDRTNPAFGIGTYLTNDLGYVALQNVIKMVSCNDQPVAKVSDAPDKTICLDESYLAYLKQVFHLDQNN